MDLREFPHLYYQVDGRVRVIVIELLTFLTSDVADVIDELRDRDDIVDIAKIIIQLHSLNILKRTLVRPFPSMET